MATDKDPEIIARTRQLIDQTIDLAVENLHLSVCGIDPDGLDDEGKRKRLDHVEKMMTLVAKHAPADLRTVITCERCRSAIAGFRAPG